MLSPSRPLGHKFFIVLLLISQLLISSSCAVGTSVERLPGGIRRAQIISILAQKKVERKKLSRERESFPDPKIDVPSFDLMLFR